MVRIISRNLLGSGRTFVVVVTNLSRKLTRAADPARIVGVFTDPWNLRGRQPSWSLGAPGKDPFAVRLFPVVTEVTSNFGGHKISTRCAPTSPRANRSGRGPGGGPRTALQVPGASEPTERVRASPGVSLPLASRAPALGRGWHWWEQQSFPGGGGGGRMSPPGSPGRGLHVAGGAVLLAVKSTRRALR